MNPLIEFYKKMLNGDFKEDFKTEDGKQAVWDKAEELATAASPKQSKELWDYSEEYINGDKNESTG